MPLLAQDPLQADGQRFRRRQINALILRLELDRRARPPHRPIPLRAVLPKKPAAVPHRLPDDVPRRLYPRVLPADQQHTRRLRFAATVPRVKQRALRAHLPFHRVVPDVIDGQTVLSGHQYPGKARGGQDTRRDPPPAGGRDKIGGLPFLPVRKDGNAVLFHQRRHAGHLHDPLLRLLTASGGEQRLQLWEQRPPLCQNRHAAALILGNVPVLRQRSEGIGQRRSAFVFSCCQHIEAGRIIQQVEPRQMPQQL